VFDADTVLVVWRARVACPACGPKLEALDWLEPHARVTNRMAENVARMCKVMPIKRVAEHYGLHWGTVKDIDKAYLDRTLEPARPGKVRLAKTAEQFFTTKPQGRGTCMTLGFPAGHPGVALLPEPFTVRDLEQALSASPFPRSQ